MERPQSPIKEEWIKYKRYATHNLPKHIRDYLEYQSKMFCWYFDQKIF